MRAVCGVAARLALPKPCGGRPESVALPCAFQLRPEAEDLDELLVFSELFGRELFALLLIEPLGREFCDCAADGGRFDESCDCRVLFKPCAVLPPRLAFPAGLLAPWFAETEAEFMVRTGMCEAAAAGVDRATTLRFSTLAEGVATRPCVLDAPRKLECVGEALTPPATRALRNELAERCVALRFIAWPFTKALCEAVVTAFALCAYR